MGVFHAPAEVIGHQLLVGEGDDAAVEDGGQANEQREARAGSAGEDGVEFADFAPEDLGVFGEEEGDFVALGVAVGDFHAGVCHQGFDGFHHHPVEALIEWRFKLADFFGEAGETSPVNAGQQVVLRRDDLVERLLVDAHLCV